MSPPVRPAPRHYLELLLAVGCLSTSGVLGRYIPLSAEMSIWWRSLLGGALLAGYCAWRGERFGFPDARTRTLVLGTGVAMAGHWVLYFYSLKLSSVAVGVLAVFTYPAMTALVEPILLGAPFVARHLGLAALALFGVYWLLPDFDLASDATLGVACGLASALLYAVRNVLLAGPVREMSGGVIMSYQMGVIALVLAPTLYVFPIWPRAAAWPYLGLLVLVTTVLGQTLFLVSFRRFSPSTASVLASVNPVFGIAWAVVLFGERPGAQTLLGGACILAAVVGEALATRRAV